MIWLASLAYAEPAVLVDCSELGAALSLVVLGAARIPAAEKEKPVKIPEGQWTLRFLTEDLGTLEVRPNTLLIAAFAGDTLELAAWPVATRTKKLCKKLHQGQLPAPTEVLVSVPLAR